MRIQRKNSNSAEEKEKISDLLEDLLTRIQEIREEMNDGFEELEDLITEM